MLTATLLLVATGEGTRGNYTVLQIPKRFSVLFAYLLNPLVAAKRTKARLLFSSPDIFFTGRESFFAFF